MTTSRFPKSIQSLFRVAALACLGFIPSAAVSEAPPAGDVEIPARPALPKIVSIALIPEKLTLDGARDARRALVIGTAEDGTWVDLSNDAAFMSESPLIHIDIARLVHAAGVGEAEISVTAAGLRAMLPVEVKSADKRPVRFVREIMPTLSNVGCNAGTCHGSAKGKNGFKLSLRGYDPDFDYEALAGDLGGRRVNRAVPDQSLMLLKPATGVPHQGGHVLDPSSDSYKLLRQWIAEGLNPEGLAEGRAERIEVQPAVINLALPGMTQQALVIAHYKDGSTRDVTRDAIFTSSQTEVAVMKTGGEVAALRRGEAAVLVRYEGSYATTPVTVMGDRSGYEWKTAEQFNYIDKLVDAKLQKMKILPSELCTDADFIRRASLDLTGIPPAPAAVRAFLTDATPTREKREKLLDDLIGSRAFVDCWTNKWSDLLQCNQTNLGDKGVWLFRGWIRDSIQSNRPYNEFVRDLLKANGSSNQNPAASYYRVLRDPGKITEDISQTFLGVRFNCAKCHDHPFERWTQKQYYEFGAFFSRVGIKPGMLPGEEIVYTRYDGGEVQHPKTGVNMVPKAPFGEAGDASLDADRRSKFITWLASAENPLFAKSMANRTWSYFFGRGIIEPVDDIRASNPAVNPELLEALTEDFMKNGFNLRHLMKTICMSRAYQSSVKTNVWNADDVANFSHAQPRRLSAEQLMDAIAVATGSRTQLAGLPAGMRPVEVANGMIEGSDFLTLFGRPMRKSACECERTNGIGLSHALNLINGRTISDALAAPDNLLAKLAKDEPDDKKVVEEVFYAVLSRPPTEREIASIDLGGASRLDAVQDLAWALMNSPAFLFNR